MKHLSYEEVGLPVCHGGVWAYDSIQCCQASRTLVVTVRSSKKGKRLRVFLRSFGEIIYTELSPAVGEIVCISSCEVSPYAFVAVEGPVGDGLTIFRMGLPDTSMVPIPSPILDGVYTRVWISSLHSVSAGGEHLIVTMALQPPSAEDGSYWVQYVLAKMCTMTGSIRVITDLPAVYA